MSLYLGSQSGLPPFISGTARGTGSASSSDVVVLKDHTFAILAGGSPPGTGLTAQQAHGPAFCEASRSPDDGGIRKLQERHGPPPGLLRRRLEEHDAEGW